MNDRTKSNKKYYYKNQIKIINYLKKYRLENKNKINKQRKQYYKNKKIIVFNHYGNKCACCGEIEPSFLVIDHVNNDGHKERTDNNKRRKSGMKLFCKIIRLKFPDTYQILCANCNTSKLINKGICAHSIRNVV